MTDNRDELPSKVAEALAEELGDTYHCSRTWEAWQYGTMTEEDFSPASEDDDFLMGAADRIINTINPQLFTKEEIHDLPVESVFEDVDGCIFEIVHNGERNSDGTFCREYVMTGDVHSYGIDEIDLPATVLKRAPETPRR